MDQNITMKFFEDIGCLYRASMHVSWNRYPNYKSDIWDLLAIFLQGYAFERQGRKPDYFDVAVDALYDCKARNHERFSNKIISEIWSRFCELLNDNNLNHQNNPLCPKGTKYTKNFKIGKKSFYTSKASLIEVIIYNDLIEKKFTLTSYIQHSILEKKDISHVFNMLTSIQGINKKISSFYLRDLVDVLKIPLNTVKNRHLLQPVDIWVRRTIGVLSNNKKIKESHGELDEEISEWIVNHCNNVNPEQVGMGIWLFGSEIAGSTYRLEQSLKNYALAFDLVDIFKKQIKDRYHNCIFFKKS